MLLIAALEINIFVTNSFPFSWLWRTKSIILEALKLRSSYPYLTNKETMFCKQIMRYHYVKPIIIKNKEIEKR